MIEHTFLSDWHHVTLPLVLTIAVAATALAVAFW
jgi:hypothetical protein